MYFASEHGEKAGNLLNLYFHQCELKHGKAKTSLYSENKYKTTLLQTQPWARWAPKAIQLHSSSCEPSAGPSWEDVPRNWRMSPVPDCSCVMALRDKIQTEKGLDCLLLGQQYAHLGFPNHTAVCGESGTWASLVLWKVTTCPCVFAASLGTALFWVFNYC